MRRRAAAAAAVAAVVAGSTSADYGALWTPIRTPTSITVDWSHPPPNLQYTSNPPLFKFCWKQKPFIVGPCTLGANVFTTQKPYPIPNLTPCQTYRVKVSGHTEKWTWLPFSGWKWRYPGFRAVGQIQASTVCPETSLGIVGVRWIAFDALASLASPSEFDMIRVGYKRRYSNFALNSVCSKRSGAGSPQAQWGTPDKDRGWVDVHFPSWENVVSLGPLWCKQKYRIKLFVFKPGESIGTKAGHLVAKTGNPGLFSKWCSYPPFGISFMQTAADELIDNEEELFALYAAMLDDAYASSDLLCGAGESDCCSAHDLPGCSDPTCEQSVCSLDPFCCEVVWDGACSSLAEIVCEQAVSGTIGLVSALEPYAPGITDHIHAYNADCCDPNEPFDGSEPLDHSMHALLEWLLLDTDWQAGVSAWQESDPFLAENGLRLLDFLAEHAPDLLEEVEVVFNTPLPGDMNFDGTIDGADLGILLTRWGSDDALADLNGDGVVDGGDLGILLNNWTVASR